MDIEDPYLDSGILAAVRTFIALRPMLQKIAGPIAQFKVVLDANMAVNDLIHKHRRPHIKYTALEEAVRSSAIEVHAPRHLEQEMIASTIPKTARNIGIPEGAIRALWETYQTIIIWHDTPLPFDLGDRRDIDPKDIPYVALQRAIDAAGVLSRDKDIDALGGRRVSIDFVLCVRDYARAASYVVGIRVGGAWVTHITFGLLHQVAKAIATGVARLPPAAKVALVVGAVLVVAHPRARIHLLDMLSAAGDVVAATWPVINQLMDISARKQLEAKAALADTERLLAGGQAAFQNLSRVGNP